MFLVKRVEGSRRRDLNDVEDAEVVDTAFSELVNNAPKGYKLHSWQYMPSREGYIREYIVLFEKKKK